MRYLLIFGLLFHFASTNAQLSHRIYANPINIKAETENALYFKVHSFSYTRNYEYFNKIADGYTLFGTQFIPQLVFQSGEHVAFSAGAFFRQDFGNRGFREIKPIFSIKYNKEFTSLIFGSIEGNTQHEYLEALYDYERLITEPIELGTQIKIDKPGFFFDAWINWLTMIYKPSDKQEEVVGGISTRFALINDEKIKLNLPVQFLAYHAGGQIDTIPDPLQTYTNIALGLKLDVKTDGFFKAFSAQAYYLGYRDFSFTNLLPFESGNGFMADVGVETKPSNISLTYFNGNKYIGTFGSPLYSSVSSQINNVGFTEANREFLILRLHNEHKLSDNLYFGTRLEPYIDLNKPKFEFSNSLYLVYKQGFMLKKFKRTQLID